MRGYVINIISGKGGTGKTLMSAVLGELLGNKGLRVLVVDLDIYVRGLTTLLYFHKDEKLHLAKNEEHIVSDFLTDKNDLLSLGMSNSNLGISRYRSFDLLPAVRRIDETLNLDSVVENSGVGSRRRVNRLIEAIHQNGEYDLIFLDCRAGYDRIISAAHELSDITICVQEEDDISLITANNLVRQLELDSEKFNNNDNRIFRVTNKARDIKSDENLTKLTGGITHLGAIPFDIDVMNSFGSHNFWEDISSTIYRYSLVNIWNNLNRRMDLDFGLINNRKSPILSEKFESKLSMFLSLKDRVFYAYGILIGALGISVGIFGTSFFSDIAKSPIQLIAFIFGLISLVAVFTLGFRKGRDYK